MKSVQDHVGCVSSGKPRRCARYTKIRAFRAFTVLKNIDRHGAGSHRIDLFLKEFSVGHENAITGPQQFFGAVRNCALTHKNSHILTERVVKNGGAVRIGSGQLGVGNGLLFRNVDSIREKVAEVLKLPSRNVIDRDSDLVPATHQFSDVARTTGQHSREDSSATADLPTRCVFWLIGQLAPYREAKLIRNRSELNMKPFLEQALRA